MAAWKLFFFPLSLTKGELVVQSALVHTDTARVVFARRPPLPSTKEAVHTDTTRVVFARRPPLPEMYFTPSSGCVSSVRRR